MTALPADVYRLTVDQVLSMVHHGLLEERVELLEGVLIDRSTQGHEHRWSLYHLRRVLERIYGDAFLVFEEKPLLVSEHSLPEPDLSVVQASAVDETRHPRGRECTLAVEIAYSSRNRDLAKAAVYARGGVATYWLVDMQQGVLRVFEQPADDGYGRQTVLRETEDVEVPGTTSRIPVKDLLR